MSKKAYLVFWTRVNEEAEQLKLECPICKKDEFDDELYDIELTQKNDWSEYRKYNGYAIMCDHCNTLLPFMRGAGEIEFRYE